MLFHLPAHPDGAPQIVALGWVERVGPSLSILRFHRVDRVVEVAQMLLVFRAECRLFAKALLIDYHSPSRPKPIGFGSRMIGSPVGRISPVSTASWSSTLSERCCGSASSHRGVSM